MRPFLFYHCGRGLGRDIILVLVAKKLGRGRRRVLSNFDDRKFTTGRDEKVATRICGRRYRDPKVNLDISMSFQAIDVKFLHVSYLIDDMYSKTSDEQHLCCRA